MWHNSECVELELCVPLYQHFKKGGDLFFTILFKVKNKKKEKETFFGEKGENRSGATGFSFYFLF